MRNEYIFFEKQNNKSLSTAIQSSIVRACGFDFKL